MSLGEDSDTSNHDEVLVEITGAATLTEAPTNQTVKRRSGPAPLHRKELVLGRMLGQGSFSQVMAVNKFSWKSDTELYLSPQERSARQRLERGGSYAVKHLNRVLLRRPKQFYQAALELAREAEYMSQLNHPNLLKARAISYGGTAALESGRYNDFFIISDRLVDTLDERISKWQRSFSPSLAIKLQYALQLASALEYLHAKRIVFW
jgi:serine/threonine protein kinase